MHPNDVELVRAFTREKGASIGDLAFSITYDFEVVVEARAGSTIHGYGTRYEIGAFVRDLTANADIPTDLSTGYVGHMTDTNWPDAAVQFVYTVRADDLSGKENHICQVYAFLKAGMVHPKISLAVSPLFMLTN